MARVIADIYIYIDGTPANERGVHPEIETKERV